ncbi:AAA domain-containing protein, putative AbiEii toxin, Type IV TA system [Chishuiella changwenlii]|uniref:AAA domain-containing protein, putative AbiEii toxin, Type IV TA system n=1 Tax=Chishuiella changwenlii TaxID=1434701 RepID=A0A1M6ZQ58_9FLAO|nr:AAA family ATPase [Chishuiella changwenlii]GGE92911.1 hypothetical protein GCM10010984_08140 [Chishuiella changwenlii]SHL32587.1 AAA domain-containing protein, putative AbiEii toxin, Type IV TA system [Chishuiella changwenlii]
MGFEIEEEELQFIVTNKFNDVQSGTIHKVLLSSDNWNDFGFYTVYNTNYIDHQGNNIELGMIRIAYYGQEEGIDAKKLKIEDQFDSLDHTYFSLGVSEDYYININKLDDELKNEILTSLNDIAYDTNILEKAFNEKVTRVSLFRDITYNTVKIQYNRIANGGALLTDYYFSYYNNQSEIDFDVKAASNPPTNIHTIIGSNGVGKSYLINDMINSALNSDSSLGKFKFNKLSDSDSFSNVICINFSAFDDYNFEAKKGSFHIKYNYIGINSSKSNKNQFKENFITSINDIIRSNKIKRWFNVIEFLNSDLIFSQLNLSDISERDFSSYKEILEEKFSKLSSGHKIILLSITKLVQLSEEKTLIFFDEPETHLHPPLLSSYIRAISYLLNNRNSVCIMTTHSPVILQEVPASCVYIYTRVGEMMKFERPYFETFGENISVLTKSVFDLEISKSGFYKILKKLVDEFETYEQALGSLNNNLGFEGKSILRSLFFDKENQ